jgi:hypothetical protein
MLLCSLALTDLIMGAIMSVDRYLAITKKTAYRTIAVTKKRVLILLSFTWTTSIVGVLTTIQFFDVTMLSNFAGGILVVCLVIIILTFSASCTRLKTLSAQVDIQDIQVDIQDGGQQSHFVLLRLFLRVNPFFYITEETVYDKEVQEYVMNQLEESYKKHSAMHPLNSKKSNSMADFEQPKASDQNEVFTFISSCDRFALWIKAIKARYWIHLGNDKEFQVNWQDAKDNTNSMVEHIVKVDKLDDQSNDYSRLFTLSLYKTKCKVMIQGLFRDHWIKREFPLLQELVNSLEEGVPPNEAYEKCSGIVMSISDSDLLLSDDDSDDAEDIEQSPDSSEQSLCKSKSIVSSLKCNKSPSKRSSKIRRRSFSSPQKSFKQGNTQKINIGEGMDLYNSLTNRIVQLEDTLSKLENLSADRVM